VNRAVLKALCRDDEGLDPIPECNDCGQGLRRSIFDGCLLGVNNAAEDFAPGSRSGSGWSRWANCVEGILARGEQRAAHREDLRMAHGIARRGHEGPGEAGRALRESFTGVARPFGDRFIFCRRRRGR
jgi:hypothetical protein